MNPFSGRPKCVARAALILAAMSILLLATACGSGGGSNGGGGGGGGNGNFSKASLNGHYTFSQRGFGVTQDLLSTDAFSEAGVFTADGNGNLTNIIDEFAQSGSFFSTRRTPISGKYTINKDGTGQLQFNFGGNQFTNFQITLTDTSHFYLIQQDQFATAAGSGEQQTTSAFNAVPTDTFIFQAREAIQDFAFASARVGSLAFNGGAISGLEDVLLAFGNVNPKVPFTGTVGAPDTSGLGQITLSDGSTFRYYVVSSNKFRFLSTSGSLELGVAEKQSGGPFSNATLAAGNSYVFGSSGDSDLAAGVHSAGVFTTDGNGSVTNGTTDLDFDGTITSNVAVQNTSNYSIDNTDGRGVLNLNLGNGTSKQDIFWMVNTSRAFLLMNSSAAVEDGTFSKQQGAPFANANLNAQGAFFMDGFDLAFKDRVGTIVPDGKGNFKWNQQANSFDPTTGIGTVSSFSTSGTNQVNANGRVTVTVNGLINGANSSMVFYLVTNNSGFVVAEDPGFDLGGAFMVQTGP